MSYPDPTRGRGSYRGRSPSVGHPRGRSPSVGRGGFMAYSGPGMSPSRSSRSDLQMPIGESHQGQLIQSNLPKGSAGKPVDLVANFFKIKTNPVSVFHYDVEIAKERRKFESVKEKSDSSSGSDKRDTPSPVEAEEISKNMERYIKRFSSSILSQFVNDDKAIFQSPYAYDGYKNLYTIKELNFSGGKKISSKVGIEIDGLVTSFVITLKLVEHVSLEDVLDFYSSKKKEVSEHTISIYELVFRHICRLSYIEFQRKFFDLETISPSPKVNLVEFVFGFTSAVNLTEMGLALNLHLKTSCVVAKRFTQVLELVRTICDIQPGRKLPPGQLSEVNRFIRHLKMRTSHSRRIITYTIDLLVNQTPFDVKFNFQGRVISIADYFGEVYRCNLLAYPLVKTTGRQCRYIPLELCEFLPNQFLANSKHSNLIQRELLLKSTNPPNVYFNRLSSIVGKISNNNTEIQREFGISLSTKPTALKGRVIDMPRQLNSDNRSPFFKAGSPIQWAVFCFDTTVTDNLFKVFVETLIKRAFDFGLNLDSPHPVTKVEIKDENSIHNIFYNVRYKTQIQFVFVAIPARHHSIQPNLIYSLTKHFCDQKFGLISQCLKSEYIFRTPHGYFENFLLKMNAKLGGLNAVVEPSILKTLPFNTQRTMVMGIDVNHPAEGSCVSLSVAAAVASLDGMFSSYTTAIRVQKKERDEIVRKLDSMVYELLLEFQHVNQMLPEVLIVFRDGVSESQFEKVKKTEISLIETGIKRFGKPMKITFIVTQKHHHTRFALSQPNTSGRNPTYNVSSGTVVDHTIVNPKYKMFYLNSHFSPMGTSKPSKYVILRDDLNLTSDNTQRLCFLLCFNSVRTRNVIAVPTPVRYADLCAYRAKLHIEAQNIIYNREEKMLEELEIELIDQLNDKINVDPSLKNNLYYC